MLNDIVNRAKKICATMNMSAYIDLVDELSREQSYADYETLRLRRNAAYLDYERETDTSEKMRKKMKKTITRTHIPGMCSLNTAAKHSGIPRKDLTKAAKDLNMRLTERNENIFITTAQMDALRNHIQTQTGRFF